MNSCDVWRRLLLLPYYAYILFSLKDKKLYIGLTNNLKKQLQAHARGDVKSTHKRRPFKLIYYEYFINKEDAQAREIFLKSGAGRKQLKSFLKKTLTKFEYKYRKL